MRWTLRFCNRRSYWTQLCVTPPGHHTPPTLQYSQTGALKQIRTWLCTSPVLSVRFYSPKTNVRRRKGSISPSSCLPEENLSIHNNAPSADVATSVQMQNMSSFDYQLKSCGSPSDVLDITMQHALTAKQVGSCLITMWTVTKKLSNDQQHLELQLMSEHPSFKGLLQTAMENAQHMDCKGLTNCVLGLVKLGVPHNSRVVQTFLQICQMKLNDFEETHMSVLASCLSHMENNGNVIALKQAFRLIIEAHLPEIQNVISLQKMMGILGKDLPESLKKKLEIKVLSMTDQFSHFNALHMISIMASMDFFSKPLMDTCTKKILDNIHGIPFKGLFPMLQACIELRYKEKELFTGISDFVASTLDKWSNKQVVMLLSAFKQLGFCPSSLMRAFAERVISSPDTLTLETLQGVLKVYSFLNYDLQHHRQPFLDCLTCVLESYLPKMSAHMLLRAVSSMCQLGHFPPAPLEQLLQNSTLVTLNNTPEKFSLSLTKMLQTVDLCLRLDRPPLPHPLSVPPSYLVDTAQLMRSVRMRPSQVLQRMLGSRTDIKLEQVVMVENCYLIDAVITNISTVQTTATERSEGESPAEGSQKIAVLCTRESDFCFGTTNPCAKLAVKIRHLKLLGYNPVLVPEKELPMKEEEEWTELLTRWNVQQNHSLDP